MANRGFLRLNLINVEGREAPDPKTRIDAVRLDGQLADRFSNRIFPPAQRLELDAFPQASNLHCDVFPKRYRHCKTGFFTLTDGQDLPFDLRVLRNPKEWESRFTTWNQLPAHFEPFKTVLNDSMIKVIKGESLGRFIEDRYNQVTSSRTLLAKAGLLNLFSKLTTETEPLDRRLPWFAFVRRIVAIGRERFYAIVDDRMGDIVRRIRDNIDNFDHYERADHSLHVEGFEKNFPDFRIFKTKLFSIKTDESKANLQLTLAPARGPSGEDVLLLDTDIDENGDLLNHLIDVILIHPISGGTHPFDIHEYLLRSDRNLQLGYELV